MKITNDTSYPIIAFGSVRRYGYGEDVSIQPGESANVSGPYVGEMGDGDCHLHVAGEIICHEGSDDGNCFQVIQGAPTNIDADGRGVTVRHHLDAPEQRVTEWRIAHPKREK